MANGNKWNTSIICGLIICLLAVTAACINTGKAVGENKEKVRMLESRQDDYLRKDVFFVTINGIDFKFNLIMNELNMLNGKEAVEYESSYNYKPITP